MKIFKIISSLFFLCVLFSCSRSNNDLADKLEQAVRTKSNLAIKNSKKYSLLRLSDITNFHWDKFYIFEEYVNQKNISEITGISWDGTTVPNGNRRMLFIYKNRIVQYVDLNPRTFPIFFYPCGETEQFEFTKRDDLFAVFKRCDKNGCRLAMVPKRCVKAFFENTK